ncbi:hypothetical protein FGO68_gene14453 [Halteria grandinella]|uniref:Uncharacterized protein n=1 Tax=Halteria grandinella TaxID=5974 RepID=A0A8J8T0J5_HALGN|nr:hypothetical protein FGO68_gene14453 [Halteria grandinella]
MIQKEDLKIKNKTIEMQTLKNNTTGLLIEFIIRDRQNLESKEEVKVSEFQSKAKKVQQRETEEAYKGQKGGLIIIFNNQSTSMSAATD